MEKAKRGNMEEMRMEQIKIEMEKWNKLSTLKQGSKVSLTSGEEAEFIRLKQKNFIGIINGQSYNIPVALFNKVLSIATENKEYLNLKKGDYFYISNSKSDALLFIFETIEKERIIGINPITKGRTRIDASLYKGRI